MTDEEYIEGLVDPETGIVPVEIDVDQIEQKSNDYVCSMVDNLSKFYYDDKFMSSHPVFRKRVESDIDSLKLLIKMRAVDSATQDSLVKAISANSGNASLYRSLTDVQRTILNIQTKIEETIRGLEAFMKGYQLELNFVPEDDSSDDVEDDQQVTTRGTKNFIAMMKTKEEP